MIKQIHICDRCLEKYEIGDHIVSKRDGYYIYPMVLTFKPQLRDTFISNNTGGLVFNPGFFDLCPTCVDMLRDWFADSDMCVAHPLELI